MDAVNAAMKVVYEGVRLAIPPNAHPILRELMQDCWNNDPARRPNFKGTSFVSLSSYLIYIICFHLPISKYVDIY